MDHTLIAVPNIEKGFSRPCRVKEFQNAARELETELQEVGRHYTSGHISLDDLRLKREGDLLNTVSLTENGERRAATQRQEGQSQSFEGQHDEDDGVICASNIEERYKEVVAEFRRQQQEERQSASQVLTCLRRPSLDLDVCFRKLQGKTRRECVLDTGDGTKSRVAKDEVVIHIAVHLSQTPAFVSEEWLVLGSTPLTALRDSIYCVMDANMKNVEKDFNSTRAREGIGREDLFDNRAYMYFEGTFYEDMRCAPNHELSGSILEFLRRNNIKAPLHQAPHDDKHTAGNKNATTTSFSVVPMENITFRDIQLRLGTGSPGLYCHQSCCEHLLIVHDIRTFDRDCDPNFTDEYPYKLSSPGVALEHHRQCEVCGLRTAKRVTYDDMKTPHSPFFWCNECFTKIHYDQDGSLIYSNLRVFPYKHDYQPALLHVRQRK